ncbi:predicted protein [Chaetoceros tenuissimus]|uniref:Uncharacterized protein n=1 Tax=Chaetoceros tenuissimus TaxID=426638 RepID=A0AAD3D1P3_9STRA|nr:predicted protein [Chaetoceros tenuissimus]
MSIVPFYSAFLTYYFYKRVVRKVSRSTFAYRTETKLHVFIWMYAVIGGFVALGLDYFNPSRKGSMCLMIEYPLSCHSSEDPDACERGNKWTTPIGAIYQVCIPTVFSFFCILVNLSKFTYYIWKEERMIVLMQESRHKDSHTPFPISSKQEPSVGTHQRAGSSVLRSSIASDATLQNHRAINVEQLPNTISHQSNEIHTASKADVEEFGSDQPFLFSEQKKQESSRSLGRDSTPVMTCNKFELDQSTSQSLPTTNDQQVGHDLAKRALVQSFLYILSFLLACSIPLISQIYRIIHKSRVPNWTFLVISLFAPLGGFFNILIYTRPKIQSIRKLFPCYEKSPWVKLFFMVIFHGGEVPDEISDEKLMDVEKRKKNIKKEKNKHQRQLVEEKNEENIQPSTTSENESVLRQYDNLESNTSTGLEMNNPRNVATPVYGIINVSNMEGYEDQSEYEDKVYAHYELPPSRLLNDESV